MKKLENLKRISYLFGLLLCVALFTLACGANNTSNSTKNNSSINSNNSNKTSVKKEKSATKSVALKDLKEVKVSKPNEGGLKQELSTKAAVSTTDKKQITFEVPANQLQGLKVGDALAINSGKNAYPATILNLPPAQISNPNPGSKVIITASVGPGVNLPANNNNYTVTYLYNNRNPRVYYIKKDYVYYDGPRPYVYITGPDRVIRRKYIRVGLINRYYTEILDELDDTYRIVEDYINDYIDNYVIPNVVEDYTNQMIDQYEEYIDFLNKRWDYDEDVNTFTVNVDDVDWEELEEQDTILTDQDITEIYEEVQTENSGDDNGYQGGGDFERNGHQGGGSFEESSGNTNDDNDDEKEVEAASADRDETSEPNSYKSESNVEETTDDDEDVNTTTFNNAGNYDDSNNNVSYDNNSQNDDSYDDAASYNDSNDNSNDNDNSSDNDAGDSYSGGDDSNDDAYETTIFANVDNDDD